MLSTIIVNSNTKSIKKAIWIYFWLLILEGALRKWILPGLSTPLLIVRDPVAIYLIYLAFSNRNFKFNNYIIIGWFLTIISIILSLLIGHSNLFVALFGARIMILHFPVIFIIGYFFNFDDLLKMGKILIILAIPMTILIALQYYSPQSAFVNRGVAGDTEGSGFGNVSGFSRPSGIFSFTSGLVLFYTTTIPFLFYFWLSKYKINKKLLISSTFALILAIPLSISRTLVFSFILSFFFMIVMSIINRKKITTIIIFPFVLIIIVGILQNVSIFKESVVVITERFTGAMEAEGDVIQGTIGKRFLGSFLGPLLEIEKYDFFTGNLGLGTNAGAKLQSGSTNFIISETEWGRIVGERGILIGFMILFLRLSFGILLFIKSFRVLRKDNILPWLLISVSFLAIINGQWAIPTNLGFSILLGGITIASLKIKKNN